VSIYVRSEDEPRGGGNDSFVLSPKEKEVPAEFQGFAIGTGKASNVNATRRGEVLRRGKRGGNDGRNEKGQFVKVGERSSHSIIRRPPVPITIFLKADKSCGRDRASFSEGLKKKLGVSAQQDKGERWLRSQRKKKERPSVSWRWSLKCLGSTWETLWRLKTAKKKGR